MNDPYLHMLQTLIMNSEAGAQDGAAFGDQEQFTIKGKQLVISTEIMRRFRIQNKKLLEQVSLLKEKLKLASEDRQNTRKEMETLVKINQDMAAALGSCPECWGENPGCTVCNGNGIPGWKESSPSYFDSYIAPVIGKKNKTKE